MTQDSVMEKVQGYLDWLIEQAEKQAPNMELSDQILKTASFLLQVQIKLEHKNRETTEADVKKAIDKSRIF